MLRSMVKAIPTSSSGEAAATPAGATTLSLEPSGDVDDDSEDEVGGDDRPKLRLKKGPTLKDDLVEIVREDPDAAAAILKSWITAA